MRHNKPQHNTKKMLFKCREREEKNAHKLIKQLEEMQIKKL